MAPTPAVEADTVKVEQLDGNEVKLTTRTFSYVFQLCTSNDWLKVGLVGSEGPMLFYDYSYLSRLQVHFEERLKALKSDYSHSKPGSQPGASATTALIEEMEKLERKFRGWKRELDCIDARISTLQDERGWI
ncbi:MAG: hypothetical protein Q9166_005878 [cf. Caloplaca sp. 2 TL-2023]